MEWQDYSHAKLDFGVADEIIQKISKSKKWTAIPHEFLEIVLELRIPGVFQKSPSLPHKYWEIIPEKIFPRSFQE
ncbi:MAG: hypothetical protein LBI81_03890 [Puniceicoccales bacterium]|jgi:hypothetical protein|nr:hypothetical protein [Puniceicoccales bacterium]